MRREEGEQTEQDKKMEKGWKKEGGSTWELEDVKSTEASH